MSMYDEYDWTEIDVVKTDDGVCIRLYEGWEDGEDDTFSMTGELKVSMDDLPRLIGELERIVEEARP